MWIDAPPFLIFCVGAALAAVLRGRLRGAVLLLVPVLGALNLIGAQEGVHTAVQFFSYHLEPFRVDRLSLLFGYLFHIGAFIGVLYSLHLNREEKATLQHVAGMLYAGSAVGAVFAGDLVTFFVFWELLSVSSVFLIWARGTERALRAGTRYLAVQVVAGVVFLAGALVYYHDVGSLSFGHIELRGLGPWLMFLAIGCKCGFPLLHNWLTDAYPEATVTGTFFLSAFTTKVAIYALTRGFAGTEILIYIGAVMTAFPIFYAVIENDLRRVLGYSMINQIGFMVVGIGIGGALAVDGAVAHAFNEVIFKGLLFMSMGAVLYRAGTVKGSDLGGLYKSMPFTAGMSMVGAASISAFPLFSGFVSKSMIMAAAAEHGYHWIWLVLLFASAGVVEHAGIKIPFFGFFGHDSGIRTKEAPLNMRLAMAVAAVLCIAVGVLPQTFYGLLPFPVDYSPYAPGHVLAQMQLLIFSMLAVFWLMRLHLYPAEQHAVNLDSDWFYRKLGPALVRGVRDVAVAIDRGVRDVTLGGVRAVVGGTSRHHAPEGQLARTWPTGSMVLWVTILLAAYLVFYLF